MAVTFPRVVRVASGDRITSANLVSLANGINARLVSGLAEPWRIVFYFYSALLQMRNPSGYLWPARGEFLEFYQNVLPTEAEWPLMPPGFEEGCNVASFMPAFVFGAEALDLDDEAVRCSVPEAGGVPLLIVSPYATGSARYNWELAKYQRGAYDPATGLLYAPAFTAARSHFALVSSGLSEHGKSYGGYAPLPDLASPTECAGSGSTTSAPLLNYSLFFSVTSAGEALGLTTKTYAGTCPEAYGGAPTDVSFIYRFPWAFVVVLNNGTTDYLDTRYYIEGPYSGGNRLVKQDGEFPSRVLNHMASQFRGTVEQRQTQSVRRVGFDTQRFFTSQYALAPAHGLQVDDTTVVADYQIYEVTGATGYPVDQLLANRNTGATSHPVTSGFCIHSLLFGAEKLSGATLVEVLNEGVVVGRVTLSPDDEGHAEDVLVLEEPATGTVTFRLPAGVVFTDNTGGLLVEPAELYSYLPQQHDWFLLMRLSGARLEPTNGTDGSGLDEDRAKEIGTDYFRWGALINQHAAPELYQSEAAINQNAVMESARQLSKRVRLLNRHQLRAYAVEGGKSILWFTRFSRGYGQGAYQPGDNPPPTNEVQSGDISPNTIYVVGGTPGGSVDYQAVNYAIGDTFTGVTGDDTFTAYAGGQVFLVANITAPPPTSRPVNGDTFDGLGPSMSPIASGSLVWGRRYVARDGGVGHADAFYNEGEEFTATALTTYTGPGVAYEVNGIREDAEPRGYSNEWLMGLQLKAFRDNEASLWKPSAYSDYYALSERCHFYPLHLAPSDNPNSLNRHFAYGQKIWLAAESGTAYRYAEQTNSSATFDFYNSCRIYEPCLEVEKTENVVGEGNEDLVKVTLRGRLHHHYNAPASISSTFYESADFLSALTAESYRTDENGILSYIAWLNGKLPHSPSSWKTGDAAANSVVNTYPDHPTATCFPHFYFVKQVEKPYVDTDSEQNAPDTKFEHDPLATAELYLRLMCEGFVDGATSVAYGCATGINAIYDYTWANVCFDANGLPWVPALAATETARLDATKVRADAPKGFGPIPLALAAAEQFNWLAAICDKLDKVRVMLPYEFTMEQGTSTASAVVAITNNDGTPGGPTSNQGYYAGPIPYPAAPTTFVSVAPGNLASCGAELTAGSTLEVTRADIRWTFQPTDPNAIWAIPLTWRNQVGTQSSMLFLKSVVNYTTSLSRTAVYGDATICNGLRGWPDGSGNYLIFGDESPQTDTCIIGTSGTLIAPALVPQVLEYDDTGGGSGECYGTAGNTAGLTPIVGDAFIFTIPLVSAYARPTIDADFDPEDFDSSDFATTETPP
jgi:hypothetical protein